MKLYEYSAAGLTVAATETEEMRRRQLPGMCLAPDEDDFANAVSGALRNARSDVTLGACRAVAQRESWQAKTQRLLALAEDAPS